MARKPFIPTTMGQLRGLRQGAHKRLFGQANVGLPPRPRLIILNFLGLSMRAILSFPGAACDRYPQFWPVPSLCSDRLRRPTAAFSSSPTRLMVMGSTSASPRARNAAPMPRDPIASRAILPWPHLFDASTRTKSPARFQRRARTALVAAATNTLPLPVSAERP